jgi:uncharacterized protein YjbI with pentapeptide repeats
MSVLRVSEIRSVLNATREAKLRQANLSGADLTAANSIGAGLFPTNLLPPLSLASILNSE